MMKETWLWKISIPYSGVYLEGVVLGDDDTKARAAADAYVTQLYSIHGYFKEKPSYTLVRISRASYLPEGIGG